MTIVDGEVVYESAKSAQSTEYLPVIVPKGADNGTFSS